MERDKNTETTQQTVHSPQELNYSPQSLNFLSSSIITRNSTETKEVIVEGQPKEVFLLVGPIAAGKSYIGQMIEEEFDIPFFRYENIFIEEQKRDPDGYLKRAEPVARKAIFDFLEKHGKMCFENTMNREYAHEIMKSLQEIADVRLIYVHASSDVAKSRLAKRDQSTHVSWTSQELEKIYNDSEHMDLDYDLMIDNSSANRENLKTKLKPLIEERVWHSDYVEINYKNQKMKFSSWSGENLSHYDTEYKPWKIAFHKENDGYLKHYNLQPGDVVIDAGGYEGTFSIYAAKAIGPTGKVIVFEPDTGNCEKLKQNIILNGLKNIIIINKALWSKDKKLKFNNKHTAGASLFFNASQYTQEIDAVSLDSELERLGIDHVDFIKMDVEGAEIHAIQGAQKTLELNNLNLAIATYHIVNGEETSTSAEEILNIFGYQSSTEHPEHKTTYGFKKGDK
ncbi:MAG: FkbM family methyltransferase [Candidatus Shapirobacteria bacterium]|jgi:FkbM family methyltransferase